MLSLATHKPEHLLSCVAACGMIDRIIHKYDGDYIPDHGHLEINAGVIKKLDPGDRDAMIAKGMFEWLREFHDDPAVFSLTNTSIKSLHRKIFKYSSRDDGTRGRYRTELDDEMRVLFDDTKNMLVPGKGHTLFAISLFRVSFINSMPFVTGNLLCTNLITYALLFSHGYSVVSRLPLLTSLNNADSILSQDPLSLLPKTLFNLLSEFPVLRCSNNNIRNTGSKISYLNPRRKSLLSFIQKYAPAKISDIMTGFPDESRNTIKKDLLHLRENGMILANGEGRGMFYIPTTND